MLYSSSYSTPIVCCSTLGEIKNAVKVYTEKGRRNDADGAILDFGCSLEDDDHDGKDIVRVTKKGKLQDQTKQISRQHNDSRVVIELENLSDWKQNEQIMSLKTACHLIVLNIGHLLGHDLYMTVLSLADHLLQTFPSSHAIIVRSKYLYSLSKRLIHSHRLQQEGSLLLPPPSSTVRSVSPFLVSAVSVNDYRKTIPRCVREDQDVVLEIGCHFGRTTQLLHQHARRAVGVDVGPKIIERAKTQYPHIQFFTMDGWNTMELLKLSLSCRQQDKDSHDRFGFDVVYVDIGGLSGQDGLLEALALLDSLGQALQPKCIVIKSLCMRQLASRLQFFPNVWDKHITKRKITTTTTTTEEEEEQKEEEEEENKTLQQTTTSSKI